MPVTCLRVMTLKPCNIAAMAVPFNRRPRWGPTCIASSNINTEQLRSQLDLLHAEAENTRTKANNGRLRLLRLSEAAEKLQRQAALNMQKGKEHDARELLFQKKKVMQALEKSKNRIELLDDLSSKLNEAITLKESQLIGCTAMDLENKTEDASGPVRIVSPYNEVTEEQPEDTPNLRLMEYLENPNSQHSLERQGSTPSNNAKVDDCEGLPSVDSFQEVETICGLGEFTSYDALMEGIDQQLQKIEAELLTILEASNLSIDNEERTMNSKVEQTAELLDGIRRLRQRIRSTKQAEVAIR